MSRQNIPDLNGHVEQAHGYTLQPDQTIIKTSELPQRYITLQRKRTAKKSLITRKINQSSQLITERGTCPKMNWLEFVPKFKDLFHDQSYLNNSQKLHYLQQHATGEARREIHGLSTDKRGYVLSLKRLKYSFGQGSRIAQAHLAKITGGKKISKDDNKGLPEFYYTSATVLSLYIN